MTEQEGVDDRVDDGLPLVLVPDAETEIQDKWQVALRRVPSRVIHRAHHAAVHGDAAARVVGDLEPDDLRAGRDTGEAADVVEVVTGRDPRHVRAVSGGIEKQIEHGHAVRPAEVRDDGERLGAERDRLATLTVIVEGHLVLERAIQVRIDEHDPAVRCPHDHHGEFIGVATVAVYVGSRCMTEGQLAEHAAIPCGRGRQPRDAGRSTQRALGGRGDGREGDTAFGGEVPQLDDLRCAGAGRDESRHVRVDAAVQNRDQDATAVVRRMRRVKHIDTGALQRHQAEHVRHRWLDRRFGRVTAIGRCRHWRRRQWRARAGSRLRSDSFGGRAGRRKEEETGDEWL